MYVCMYVHVYIYIYIYIYRLRFWAVTIVIRHAARHPDEIEEGGKGKREQRSNSWRSEGKDKGGEDPV